MSTTYIFSFMTDFHSVLQNENIFLDSRIVVRWYFLDYVDFYFR